MDCAICADKKCYSGKDCTKFKDIVIKELNDKENLDMCITSSRLESEHYMELTRLEETFRFAGEMAYEHLGIAFCIGFSEEARILHDIFSKRFKISSACCKLCGIDKKNLGLPNIEGDRYEAICNPIGQATALNEQKTEMNIILGLCVGHDMLFTKYSKAPVTTLVAKDRVLAHNPVAALTNRYYRKQLADLPDRVSQG